MANKYYYTIKKITAHHQRYQRDSTQQRMGADSESYIQTLGWALGVLQRREGGFQEPEGLGTRWEHSPQNQLEFMEARKDQGVCIGLT